jgi:hypothetical protein
MSTVTWIKSSYSGNGSQCVEVAKVADAMGVRDSKQHGAGPELWVSADAGRAFVASVVNGTFSG